MPGSMSEKTGENRTISRELTTRFDSVELIGSLAATSSYHIQFRLLHIFLQKKPTSFGALARLTLEVSKNSF